VAVVAQAAAKVMINAAISAGASGRRDGAGDCGIEAFRLANTPMVL
jgi:hypothetical protein